MDQLEVCIITSKNAVGFVQQYETWFCFSIGIRITIWKNNYILVSSSLLSMSLLQFNFCGSGVQYILLLCCDNFHQGNYNFYLWYDQKTQFYSKMQYQIAMNHINDTIFELLVSKLWVKTSQFSNMNFKQNLNVFIIIAHTSPPIRFV